MLGILLQKKLTNKFNNDNILTKEAILWEHIQ